MKKLIASDFVEIGISALGAGTTVITAVILAYLTINFDISFFLWRILYVIPIGAILSGIVAGSGFYFGALLYDRRPAGGILLNMVLASFSAFLLIHYLIYQLMIIEGAPVSDIIDFYPFLEIFMRATPVPFERLAEAVAQPQSIEIIGFAFGLLEVAGFGFGGFILFHFLRDQPYCDECSQFRNKILAQDRFIANSDVPSEKLLKLLQLVELQEVDEAVDFHANSMGEVETTADNYIRTRLTLHHCGSCGTALVGLMTSQAGADEWEELLDQSFDRLAEYSPKT